jgi:stage V sporulation protein SpoVS
VNLKIGLMQSPCRAQAGITARRSEEILKKDTDPVYLELFAFIPDTLYVSNIENPLRQPMSIDFHPAHPQTVKPLHTVEITASAQPLLAARLSTAHLYQDGQMELRAVGLNAVSLALRTAALIKDIAAQEGFSVTCVPTYRRSLDGGQLVLRIKVTLQARFLAATGNGRLL